MNNKEVGTVDEGLGREGGRAKRHTSKVVVVGVHVAGLKIIISK